MMIGRSGTTSEAWALDHPAILNVNFLLPLVFIHILMPLFEQRNFIGFGSLPLAI
jgi:hypothetical protein